ncbi:MAG: glycosyltransferase, exosortase A system-associated [Hyphomicrobiales bacterium]|nr:glycosyltransferase, exosortase A system-associated [Hyphomicrobiales bacterium]
MRILHIFDHSVPMQSGYTFRSLSILRQQRALGWETHHLTTPKHVRPGPAEEEVDGFLFHRTPAPGGPLAAMPGIGEWLLMRAVERRLDELIPRLRPHVLHAHSPALNGLPAVRAGRRHGLPVVYEMRASWEDAAVSHGTTHEGSLRYRLGRGLESHVLRRADAITTICQGLRDEMVESRGIAPGKVTIIPNAVDVEEFTFQAPKDTALATELGLDDAVVVGFVGSFYEYEGLDVLLRAMPAVLETEPRARLLLVGGGQAETGLRALAGELGLGERLLFTGRVPHDQVQRYYGLIDVLAYPRKNIRLTDLVTPLKPLEAMAQGKMFVASDVGGHRELIRNGETGTLFAADDPAALAAALTGLLAERDAWPARAAVARRFVEEERNWRVSVANYVPLYGRLTGRA